MYLIWSDLTDLLFIWVFYSIPRYHIHLVLYGDVKSTPPPYVCASMERSILATCVLGSHQPASCTCVSSLLESPFFSIQRHMSALPQPTPSVASLAAKKFIFEEEKIRFWKLFPFTRSMQQFPVFQICLPPNVILQSERQEPLRREKTD